jgi:hypothetical protein
MNNTRHRLLALALIGFIMVIAAATAQSVQTAPQWQEVELTFTAERETANPYTGHGGLGGLHA